MARRSAERCYLWLVGSLTNCCCYCWAVDLFPVASAVSITRPVPFLSSFLCEEKKKIIIKARVLIINHQVTYFCLSTLYEAVSSSNSLELTSMKVLRTLYTSATIVWFQCSFEMRYSAGNIMGIITALFSSIKVRMYSLFQKNNALSATWKVLYSKGIVIEAIMFYTLYIK